MADGRVIKIAIAPLATTAYTTKQPKKRKAKTEQFLGKKRETDRARNKTRVNIGVAFRRWRELMELKDMKSDSHMALILLDSYEKSQTSAPCQCGPAMRMPVSLVSSICEESLSGSSTLEKHPDGSLDVVKRYDPACDQETKADPPAAIDFHLSPTNMPCGEDGCTEITFDVSEINFATDEDSSCTNQDEEEEEKEEEEEDEEEEEADVSDLEWSKELSDSDQLEKTDSDKMELNSKVHRKVRERCPECGVHFTAGRTHTCEYKIKKFLCNVCDKRCTDLGSLKAHSNIHRESYEHPCKFCLVPFKTRLDKLAHERAHKGSPRPYECPDCTMKFSKLPERNLHLKGHRGPKIFSCPHCSLEFPSRHYMNRHIVVHTGMKQFVCEFCRRSFNQAGHLKTHMRVHTGERPYQCQHCDMSFNHKVSLKSHVMRYHEAASEFGLRGHTQVKMESTGAGVEEVNEKVSTGETEDMGDDVINRDPKLNEEPKQFRKTYYRSMGRPKGRPKRNAGTSGTNSIPAVRGEVLEPITAVDTSEQASEQASKNIERDWSDRTSELTEEDEVEETKGVRKREHKASQRPKTFYIADEFFDSDLDCDLAEEEPKERLSQVKKSRRT